jgi:mannan endo-1,4-beta-mannosidase
MLKNQLSILLLLFTAVFILSNCSKTDVYNTRAINPNATREASQLLDFLYEISGKYTLTGHHNGSRIPTEYLNAVYDMTGYHPVVWGSDFSFNFRDQKETDSIRQAVVDTAIALNERGYIITLMWHACYPIDGDTCGQESIWRWADIVNQEEWDQLTTEGTELNKLWKDQVDNVAGYLKQLQNARVPVLWRPYHEMNGIWFWWCNQPGEKGFVKLWKMMYEYFTNHHKLNNLIWVWNANAPRDKKGDEAYAYSDYFPGLEYVDILAADVYHNDYRQSHHDQLLELGKGKPIALGEVGRMPTENTLLQQPKWTWFMGWANWLYKANDEDSVKALYNSSTTISMDMLKKNEQGSYYISK